MSNLKADALFAAMVDVSLAHADRLRELGPVRVLTLDPCPRCGGRVLAGETVARCVACSYTIARREDAA